MKLTRIKSKLPLEKLAFELERAIRAAGYISEAKVINSTRIDIGLHMRSFKVNTAVHGYNASYNPFINYKAGFKRTNTPTWDQRVEYNNVINKVLNKYKVSCKIKSGDFIIRDGLISMTESDWMVQKPSYISENELKGFLITKLPKGA